MRLLSFDVKHLCRFLVKTNDLLVNSTRSQKAGEQGEEGEEGQAERSRNERQTAEFVDMLVILHRKTDTSKRTAIYLCPRTAEAKRLLRGRYTSKQSPDKTKRCSKRIRISYVTPSTPPFR